MTVIGSAEFAVLLWGTILAVSAILLYEAYTIADEFGWLSGKGGRTDTPKAGDES